jgi:hypothetical protein
MRIFMFKSRGKPNLRAFAGDATGAGLPSKYAPWDSTGVVRPDVSPPYGFSRKIIEAAILRDGFQLWVMEPLARAQDAAKPAS